MRSIHLIPLAVLAFAAACSENASNPVDNTGPSFTVHLKGGGNAEPSFTDGGLFLSASGALSGLGNESLTVGLSATATATATCSNPGNATQPAGQNPAPVTVSGTQQIPSGSIINGNVSFNVQTTQPSPNPRPATKTECPNTSWTYTITDLRFTSATIKVFQPDASGAATGPVVLTVSCTFTQPTAGGSVAGNQVSCTQTN